MNKNIIVIILILGFIGVVVLLDIPKVQGIFDLKNQIENQQKVLEEKQYLVGIVEKLRDAYDSNKETLNKLEYIVPKEQEVPNLIVQLETIAVKGGLVLREVGFTAEKKDATTQENYESLIVNMNLTGDYAALGRFLSAVEENIRLMDVKSITFTTQSEAASIFNFNVVFKVYYR